MRIATNCTITLILFITLTVFAAMDTKSLFDQGTEAFKSGNFGSAELLFKKVVESEDDEYIDQAWFYLARSIFGKQQYESAIFEFKRFLSRCKTEQLSTESRYWMGESYYRISDYPNSIEEFRRFIAVSTDMELVTEAHGRIGRIYRIQKRYDEAIIEWETAISTTASALKKASLQLWIGEALFANGKFDDAQLRLASLLAGTADRNTFAQARVILGRIWQRKKNHQMALQVFNGIPDALLKDPPFDEVLFFKARSYIKLGNTALARNLLDLFLATGKRSEWYYNALYEKGKILVQGTGKEEGLKIFEQVRAEAVKPELRSWASRLLANTYIASTPGKAVPYLEESLKTVKAEKRSGLILVLGKTCLKAKMYDKALEYLELFLKENPFDKGRDEVNFIRARVYIEKGDVDRAVRIFETIRSDNPFSKFNTESNYYLALISYKKGDTGRAIALLHEYGKQKSGENIYDAQVLLMQAYIRKNELDNAGKTCDLLIRDYINRKDIETVILQYALALVKKGRDAQRYMKFIVTKFPESETTSEIYFMDGNDNFNRAAYETALDYFNRYLATGYTANRGNAFYRKILSLYNLRRYNEVIAIIKKGNFPPMNESQWKDIPLIQARSYYNQKRYDEVYMVMDVKNIAGYPRPDIFMFIKCALHVGDHRAAMMASEYLERDKPLYAESLYTIGNYYMKHVSRDEAELFFTKIVNECPGTKFVDQARVSLGELLFMNRKYQSALNLLSDINGKEVRGRRDSLIIACLFEMNLDEKAVSFTRERLEGLLADEYGETAIKYNVKYHYEKKDIQQFEIFIKYLSRFKGNEDLINHYSGRLYFETGNYYRSYNSFMALSKTQNRYLDEALLYLGIFNLLMNRSVPGAVSCFTRLCALKEADKSIQMRAMIYLAVIYHEMNDQNSARGFLDRVLASTERGLAHVQAGNLYELFGYGAGKN